MAQVGEPLRVLLPADGPLSEVTGEWGVAPVMARPFRVAWASCRQQRWWRPEALSDAFWAFARLGGIPEARCLWLEVNAWRALMLFVGSELSFCHVLLTGEHSSSEACLGCKSVAALKWSTLVAAYAGCCQERNAVWRRLRGHAFGTRITLLMSTICLALQICIHSSNEPLSLQSRSKCRFCEHTCCCHGHKPSQRFHC